MTENLGLASATHESAPEGFWSCMSYNDSVEFTYVGYSDGPWDRTTTVLT